MIDALQRHLARYGGREAHGRDDQISHAMLDNEIKEQHVMGTVLPSIFLGVAAFLLNVVISRLVATQREQIAALKALGYPNRGDRGALPEDGAARSSRSGFVLGIVLGRLAGHAVHACCTPSSSASRSSSTGSRPGWC